MQFIGVALLQKGNHMKSQIAIIGCGRLGTHLGIQLFKLGYPIVGVYSHNEQSAQLLSNQIGHPIIGKTPWDVSQLAHIVFITTNDDQIESVCEQIAHHKGFMPNSFVFHCSGSLPSTILSSAKQNHAFIGSMHPLQSFANKTVDSNRFNNVYISVEGDPEAIDFSKQLIYHLKGQCITIKTQAKILYHAAAVTASNYLVTLLAFAKKLNQTAGIDEQDALSCLMPLIQGTLANMQKMSIPEALTGPIARGDQQTISNHMNHIEKMVPQFKPLYQCLGTYTVDIAMQKGTLSQSDAESIHSILTRLPQM